MRGWECPSTEIVLDILQQAETTANQLNQDEAITTKVVNKDEKKRRRRGPLRNRDRDT